MMNTSWIWLGTFMLGFLFLASLLSKRFSQEASALTGAAGGIVGISLIIALLLLPLPDFPFGQRAMALLTTLPLLAGTLLTFYVGLGNITMEHRQTLEAFCAQRGYSFEEARPGAEVAYGDLVPIFSLGTSHEWGWTITGRNPYPFTAFNYRYSVPDSEGDNWSWYALMLWTMPEVTLPGFWLISKGGLPFINDMLWRRKGSGMGLREIPFRDDAAFSAAYQLLSDGQEVGVRALFTPELRDFFVLQAGRCGADGRGSLLVYWRRDSFPTGDALDSFLTEGEQLRRLFAER